jgi:hypothetical protein
MITKGCVGQVQFGVAVNCNILRNTCKIIILLNYINIRQWQTFLFHCYIFGLTVMQLDKFIFPALLSPIVTHSDQSFGWTMEESRVECRNG